MSLRAGTLLGQAGNRHRFLLNFAHWEIKRHGVRKQMGHSLWKSGSTSKCSFFIYTTLDKCLYNGFRESRKHTNYSQFVSSLTFLMREWRLVANKYMACYYLIYYH